MPVAPVRASSAPAIAALHFSPRPVDTMRLELHRSFNQLAIWMRIETDTSVLRTPGLYLPAMTYARLLGARFALPSTKASLNMYGKQDEWEPHILSPKSLRASYRISHTYRALIHNHLRRAALNPERRWRAPGSRPRKTRSRHGVGNSDLIKIEWLETNAYLPAG